MSHYWSTFVELIRVPFQEVSLIWGIVPLYVALLLNELTSTKASFRTAIQTGFSFIWASAQWLYPFFKSHEPRGPYLGLNSMLPIKLFVTFVVLALGVTALLCGILRKFPKYGKFLGYTRFANYFMITFFPMQVGHLPWTWDALIAIVLFAPIVWVALHFGLMPLRNK